MQLAIDKTIMQDAREDAKAIAKAIKAFIDEKTTTSVERSILRLLGIDQATDFGVPLVNAVVDHIVEHGDLSRGVCHYMAHAVKKTDKSPKAIATLIASGKMHMKDFAKKAVPDYSVLTPYFLATEKIIQHQAKKRREHLHEYDVPEKYVIVATGNIYEDIKQALSAVEKGADIIAVIRTTGQSLLDYVPDGVTQEGFGGTYATQENFRLMREALDESTKTHGRYIKLVNYASGLCMPEIAVLGAIERLDMMLNDSLYGIIFRDINMQRTFIDQHFSRVIGAYSDIVINTGEDNYLTTTDAFDNAHTVIASQFINEQFASLAGMPSRLMGLGHAYEIDPAKPHSFLYEIANAQLSRQCFPNAPLKYMPPTKHMHGDIFNGIAQNTLFNIAAQLTGQNIHLLGMLTEAIHTPFVSDRALALNNAKHIETAMLALKDELTIKPGGMIEKRANDVLKDAKKLLESIREMGLFKALEKGTFADIARTQDGGKGLEGVFDKHPHYRNIPMERFMQALKAGESNE